MGLICIRRCPIPATPRCRRPTWTRFGPTYTVCQRRKIRCPRTRCRFPDDPQRHGCVAGSVFQARNVRAGRGSRSNLESRRLSRASARALRPTATRRVTLRRARKSSMDLRGASVEGWYAPDISNDSLSKIAAWKTADLAHYLKTGTSGANTKTFGPMQEVVHDSLQYLTDADLLAMAVYLKDQEGSTRPIAPDKPRLPAERLAAGKLAYEDNCSSCHQADGKVSRAPHRRSRATPRSPPRSRITSSWRCSRASNRREAGEQWGRLPL